MKVEVREAARVAPHRAPAAELLDQEPLDLAMAARDRLADASLAAVAKALSASAVTMMHGRSVQRTILHDRRIAGPRRPTKLPIRMV